MAEPVIIEFVPAPVVEVLFPDAVKGDPGDAGASGWDLIPDKPAEFPPEDHTHAIADTTGLQAALDAKVGSEIVEAIFATRFIAYSDFSWYSGLQGLNVVPYGTGTISQVNVSGHSGAAQFLIASTSGLTSGIATGRVGSLAPTNDIQIGIGKSIAGGLLQVSSTLSTVGNPYALLIGFVDSVSSVTNGCYFRYDQTKSVWQAICKSGGVQTAVDTDITVDVSTTYRWRIEINAAGNQALFHINGVLKATITTNIPTGTINRVHGNCSIFRPSAGSGATSLVLLMRVYWIIED